MNEKAKTYVVGFFNGDLKVFSKHDNKEVLSVKSLHTDRIEDLVFIRNDALDKKIVVSISGKPDSQLKVSEVSHVGGEKSKQYSFNIIAEGKEEYAGTEGFRAISENPMNNQYICTGGVISTSSESQDDGVAPISIQEQGILIWKLDQTLLGDSSAKAK